MAIAINDNWERDQYIAAAAQTVFTVSFPFMDETYLTVYQRGFNVEPNNQTQILTLGADYTVTGVGNEAGGTIVLTVAAALDDIITIIGTEPIERLTVFADLNPFTVSMNQQLNELTIMVKQVETILNHLTPKYRYDELISDEVRPLNRELPILNDGYIWIGRGDYLDVPDDIIAVRIGDFDALGLLDVDYVVGHGNPALPNAQVLDDIGDGIMATNGGVVSVHDIVGGDGITVVNGDGSAPGDIVISTTGGSGVSKTITQPAHGFSGAEWVTINGANYVTAQANTAVNAEGIWFVSEVIDINTFKIQQAGYVDSFIAINPACPYVPLVAGTVYFLSDVISGEISSVEPSDTDTVSKPCFIADGTDKGWIFPFRGMLSNGNGGGGGGGSGDSNKLTVTQVAHGFAVEDVLKVLGSGTFEKAQADTYENAQAVGVVVEVIDADTFVLQTEGYTGNFAGKTVAGVYYLSATVAGLMTLVQPDTPGNFSKPIFVALTTGAGFILEQRQLKMPMNTSVITVNQVAHGFAQEDVLRVLAAGTYTKAQANSLANSRAVGIVVEVIDADNFVLQTEGISSAFAGKTAAQNYWLSATVAGLLTAVEPTTAGQVSKPMFMGLTATSGYILEQRPMLQPNANGGGGAAGGGLTLIDSFTFAGEPSWTFTGISAAYIGYKVVVDELLLSGNKNYVFRFGFGGPSVISELTYYGFTATQNPGNNTFSDRFDMTNRIIDSSLGAGPLSMTFEMNNLSSAAVRHAKKIYNFNGIMELPPVNDPGFAGREGFFSGYSMFYYATGVPVTSILFFTGDVPGTFLSGSIRIYGYSA